MLAGNALSRIQDDVGNDVIKEAEAYYRLEEYLDIFESGLELPVESENGNVGTLRWSGTQQYPGFELSYKSQLVHIAGFSRK